MPAPSATATTSTTITTALTPTTAPVAVATPVTMPYSGYPYTYGVAAQQQQQYRPQNGATQYSSYTPQFYSYAAQSMHQNQQNVQANYYGQQQQGYAAAAYSGWYNSYAAQAQAATAAGGSGRGTPQPMQVVNQTVPATQPAATGAYGSFIGGTARTPAVANTVYTPQVAGGAPPVLPAHLRQQGNVYQQAVDG